MSGVRFGVNLQTFGQRPAAWQVLDLPPDAPLATDFWLASARIAERGHIDTLFFADHPSYTAPNPRPLGLVEPLTLAAEILAATHSVGVVVSASTGYNDPVDLAARLQTLDVSSGGRLGWNVVTTYSPDVAGNFGVDANPPRSERYARAEEFVGVVRAVWDAAGRGDGRARGTGERFPLDARVDLPASAQRHPVIFQAGGSAAGLELAARHADGVFAVELTHERARERRASLQARAHALGRPLGAPAVFPGLSLVLGSTEREARERYDDLESRVPPTYMLGALSAVLGADARTLPLDEPIPAALLTAPWDADAHTASVGYRETFLAWIATTPTATVRDVLRHFGGYGARILIGTPEQTADTIEHWYRTGAADGFNLMLDRYPDGLGEFVDEVVPLLQRRGVYREDAPAATLRERLSPTVAGRTRASA